MCEGPATGGSLLFKQIEEAVRPGPPPTKAFSRLKHPQAEISQQLPARCSRFSPQWPLHSFSKVSLILSFSVPALGLHFLQSKQLEIHVCCLSLIPQLGCIFWGHKVDSRVATVKQLKLKKSIVLFGSVEDRVGAPVGDSLSENSVLWNCTLTADHRALSTLITECRHHFAEKLESGLLINTFGATLRHFFKKAHAFQKLCCLITKSSPTLCDPMISGHHASLSFTISQNLLKFTSIELVMLSNDLILCCLLLLLSSIFPASGSFQ